MKFSSLLLAQCCAILVTYVHAVDQRLKYDRALSGTIWTIDMTFHTNGEIDIGDTIGIIDAETGIMDANCQYTNNAGFTYNSVLFQMQFFVDTDAKTLKHSDYSSTECPLVELGGDDFRFYIRSVKQINTNDAADREFIVDLTSDQNDVTAPASVPADYVGPQSATLVDVTPATSMSDDLEILDEGDSSISSIPLGNPFRLRYTMTITSFDSGLDIMGAELVSCFVDDSYDFDASAVEIIDSTGCWKKNDVFDNMYTTRGASKNDGESSVGGTLTFVTETDLMEAVRFKPYDKTTIEFMCDLRYCFDDSCDVPCNAQGRRKRSLRKPDMTLRTSLSIYRNETVCEKCVKSTTFVASTASIGMLAAIVCGLMACAFVGTRKIGMSPYLKGHRSKLDHFRSNSSTQSMKSGSSADRSSSAGSVRKL